MERIRQLRNEKGLSQVKLAVMADMDPATLNRLERGTGNPNLKTLERVADALGVGVADLLPKVLRLASPEPSFNDVLAGERRRPEHLRDQLRIRGVEVSGSEAIVLAQYLEVEENPPDDTYVIAHVVKEDEPVDHDHIARLLTYVVAHILTDEERVALGEARRRELVAA
ncbi:MAG: helix-turn-helix domain-containing protein [Actinomycetota bacterium]|nr:helix-turn-helix domain-containing protein [Actinomycetota bacterium]